MYGGARVRIFMATTKKVKRVHYFKAAVLQNILQKSLVTI